MKSFMAVVFGVLVSFSSTPLKADEIIISDARKNIPLADDEPSFKDYYLSGKDLSAIKKNSLVTVVRKIDVKDSTGSHSLGEISVPVGQLKVIFIQGKVAVAREHKLFSRSELPMLEQSGLLIGDRIDLEAKIDDSSKPKK
ncbi:MAG: hypothetical protein AABY64_07420 [Bdellovibrionota bacterium]